MINGYSTVLDPLPYPSLYIYIYMLAHELSFWKAAAGIVVNHKRSSKNKPPTTDDFNATASSSLSLSGL